MITKTIIICRVEISIIISLKTIAEKVASKVENTPGITRPASLFPRPPHGFCQLQYKKAYHMHDVEDRETFIECG